ncbi:MAG: type 4a pilus biogenesis protein PilO [Desulfuromonadales bacterium]|nr:type 4a pilus biogenesis protein PilO [Desulfuromonadales bacterium]
MKEALLEILRLKKRLLIALGLLVLLTTALFVAVDGYQAQKIAVDQLKWGELRRQVAGVGRRDVSATYRQGKADLETLRSRIPTKRQFPRLLGDILEQAASSGVTTGPITYKPHVVKGENLLTYELSLGVSGGYAANKSFLADLLKNRDLLIVDEVSMTNSDQFEENVTMDLRLTIFLREDV